MVKGSLSHKLLRFRFTEIKGFFTNAFNHYWRQNSKLKKTIEFFNHDLSQIKNEMHQIENATFLAFRDAMKTSQRYHDYQHRNYGQVDAVLSLKMNDCIVSITLQNKTLSKDANVNIRKHGKLPYDRNNVDAFVFFIRDGDVDTKTKEAWTSVMVLSARNMRLNLIKTTLCISEYINNVDYFIFRLNDEVEQIIDKIYEFHLAPKLSDDMIAADVEAAHMEDVAIYQRRVGKTKVAEASASVNIQQVSPFDVITMATASSVPCDAKENSKLAKSTNVKPASAPTTNKRKAPAVPSGNIMSFFSKVPKPSSETEPVAAETDANVDDSDM